MGRCGHPKTALNGTLSGRRLRERRARSSPVTCRQTEGVRMTQESSGSRFEIYRDYAGRYRWRLRGRGKRITADSPQSYASPESAREAARRVKAEANQANVVEPLDNENDSP